MFTFTSELFPTFDGSSYPPTHPALFGARFSPTVVCAAINRGRWSQATWMRLAPARENSLSGTSRFFRRSGLGRRARVITKWSGIRRQI